MYCWYFLRYKQVPAILGLAPMVIILSETIPYVKWFFCLPYFIFYVIINQMRISIAQCRQRPYEHVTQACETCLHWLCDASRGPKHVSLLSERICLTCYWWEGSTYIAKEIYDQVEAIELERGAVGGHCSNIQ